MSEQMTTTLGAVLTHTTGTMVAVIDEFFPLQDFIVGRDLWTHERTAPENNVTADLLTQFPRLAEAAAPKISTYEEATAWIAEVSAHTGYPLAVQVQRRDRDAR